MRLLKTLLVECRRFLSVLVMPWTLLIILCAGCTWLALGILDLQAIVLPVLKFLAAIKVLVLKLIPGGVLSLLVLGGGKLASVFSELVALILGFVSGIVSAWKAWTVKKSLRHGTRFVAATSARFLFFSAFTNFLFGKERKGLRQLPGYLKKKLETSAAGRVIIWWKGSSDRTKRLTIGIVLCVVLIIVGQSILGLSILLFDLIWEIVLLLFRALAKLWRWIAPLLMRLMPNTIGNFITKKLIPMAADVVPVIRDDHRVMYMRFNLRKQLRGLKYHIYRYSRVRRSPLRKKIRSVVPQSLRRRKRNVVDKAVSDHVDADR